ncbi:MAG: prolyl oligopeptidase family serine peptidase [Verrucomicrobiota bacterium]|nr:prolyl oligopeptidase family serine peptidase [Verrucomicrobiota bacterium]
MNFASKPCHHGLLWRAGLMGVVCMLQISGMQAAGLMTPGLRLNDQQIEDLRRTLEPLNEALEVLVEPDHAWAATYLPDVLIYQKAVASALEHREFHDVSQLEVAKGLIEDGLARAAHLLNGRAPWASKQGLVVRGYRSRIDDSIQPYGLVVPENWDAAVSFPFPMDVWLHGRDNRLTELKFIEQRQRSAGTFAPANTLVIHPYGRFCNAVKFAGETDVFEAMEAVKRHYPVDDRRIAIRGFSMGGAGCWHLAVHHADQWVAATPGAGFAESAEYLGLWKKEIKPLWFETQLWRLYDADVYAMNLFHLPTLAYSGGNDKQIQAAQVMEKAMAEHGMDLAHLIGPETGHAYHPQSKEELVARHRDMVRQGKEVMPAKVRLTTFTLRYPEMHWVRLEGLQRHWHRARVEAEIRNESEIELLSENVSALTLHMPAGSCPLSSDKAPVVSLDGQRVVAPRVGSDRSWKAHFVKKGGQWQGVEDHPMPAGQWRKKPGLQGPIDDAFMDRFVVVKPSGQARRSYADRWARREMGRLTEQWRAQFRGEALQVLDLDFQDDAFQDAHWVLFGTPETNAVLKKILPYLPLKWRSDQLMMGPYLFDAARHVPVMIYPNPLNPGKYVVINSGFTFRGFGSNATQVPRLPDYAVIDARTRASEDVPGRIELAGFFDEAWQWGF